MVKKKWKKIVLRVFVGIVAGILIVAVAIFIWMQTWKTYEFPDKQGSIKFPSTWTLMEKSTDLNIKLNRDAWNFAEIKNDSNNISFVRYLPLVGKTDEEDARLRAESLHGYLGLSLPKNITIGNKRAYTVSYSNIHEYHLAYNGYVYQITTSSNLRSFNIINDFLFKLVIAKIELNFSAKPTSEKANLYN